MLMIVLMFVFMFMMVIVVVMLAADGAYVLFLQLGQSCGQGVPSLDGGQQLAAGELIPGGGHHQSLGIVLLQQGHGGVQPDLGNAVGAAEHDGRGVFHLIVEELTEVFHIHLALGGVHHGDQGVELDIRRAALDGFGHVGQLAHAGGLDEDAVRGEFFHHLGQGLREIAHQRAADAAGAHLPDLDARVLQEAAVDGDIAEFVFDQHQLLAGVGFGDELLDQGGLARA